MKFKEFTISCYENEIPEFVGSEMERSYETPFNLEKIDCHQY